MAVRGWGGSFVTAIGVAAGAGAAQLGLGYGLGILAWLPVADHATEGVWTASLGWATWIAATSAVIGAVIAQRLGHPAPATTGHGQPAAPLPTAFRHLALALAAAVGALVTVALVAVPARTATRADTLSPQSIAGGHAVFGVLLGLLVAVWAMYCPAVARNVVGTVGWLWSVAVVGVILAVAAGRDLETAQLGAWQVASGGGRFWVGDHIYLPGAALALGSALLIGALAAGAGARRSRTRVGAVVSGAAGPLMVAAVYLIATPRLAGIDAGQLSAYLMAPYAVLAGLLGSALMAALAQPRETDPPQSTEDPTSADPVARTGQEPAGDGARAVVADRDGDAAGPAPGGLRRGLRAMAGRPRRPAEDDAVSAGDGDPADARLTGRPR